jgi:hypothetical protein
VELRLHQILGRLVMTSVLTTACAGAGERPKGSLTVDGAPISPSSLVTNALQHCDHLGLAPGVVFTWTAGIPFFVDTNTPFQNPLTASGEPMLRLNNNGVVVPSGDAAHTQITQKVIFQAKVASVSTVNPNSSEAELKISVECVGK